VLVSQTLIKPLAYIGNRDLIRFQSVCLQPCLNIRAWLGSHTGHCIINSTILAAKVFPKTKTYPILQMIEQIDVPVVRESENGAVILLPQKHEVVDKIYCV
jgi:hypothetical protein